MEEIWKDIEGYEGLYQVSNFGKVKSLSRLVTRSNGHNYYTKERIMKPSIKENGYYKVNLIKDSKGSNKYLHRLVLQAFYPKENQELFECNHKNFDLSDNSLSNLEWVTHKENFEHRVQNGRILKGELLRKAKLKEADVLKIRSLLLEGNKLNDLANQYNVSFQLISNIKLRKVWKHI